ncbi:putative exodeoxyribonuclease VII small subunit [Moraxella macacae 0408225]|uniref:Putative exodeoxyribonuclease VII small subunit n=1 Tax=Moraxella macacae 0408225 TaxID=1230338 RepID=L2F6B5_9GAMM|nr:exodeoxyribonuclease VII small subunit [Moraxella macacae]ELA08562.1 putative exodeoxyribonuclease VII small subunit [Moraxella macacae 0408225]
MKSKQNFQSAYEVLQHNAQLLQQNQQPNIDELMQIVSESISAYQVCQSRIFEVEQALQQAFKQQALDN